MQFNSLQLVFQLRIVARKVASNIASGNISLLCVITASPSKLGNQLQTRHVTLCNLPLTAALSDKSQRKLHTVTLA